ncbi:DNA-binding transcriptional LysR family regulator [Paenibacillus turicensis]|uniref:DNA-binding transcriptional LysR family regulator n=1 Tax=Paenibacillus turicensis TaxID=160487 RepID=A0ABS4FUV1_9BACL|nr:LysR family transcriptional regulator [Paenibacillus turicensis]MBP1906133.1 DNA-binding transcriptional LysR family regulator [Paenibacillus turicensis]
MDIENMIAFNKVAELKSISAAANELNHLQSNMSNKIKNIEKHFKAQLFYRHSYGVELTADGEKLYQQFKKMILLWEETEDIISEKEENISIGIMLSSFPLQLNTIATQFYQAFPNKKLSIISGNTDELIFKVLNGELNIAYITELENTKQYLNHSIKSQTLSRDKLVFTGNMKGRSLHQLLSDERFYVSSKQCYSYKALITLMSNHNVNNEAISEINIVETLLDICKNDLGIGIVPESLALKYNFLDYKVLPDEVAALRKMLIYHTTHSISNAERWFIEKSKLVFRK